MAAFAVNTIEEEALMNSVKFAVLTAAVAMLAHAVAAGDSTLDPTFGDGGIASTSVGSVADSPGRIALQPDGRIVQVGRALNYQSAGSYGYDIGLVRFNADGGLDLSFGQDGKVNTDIGSSHPVYTDETVGAVAVQADGKIVVAGSRRRYTKSGSASFEWNQWDVMLLRYDSSGNLDPGFGTGGKVVIDLDGKGTTPEGFNDVAFQSDGKIIGVGYTYPGNNRFLIMRFNTDGSLDTSFGAAGTGVVVEHFSIATLEDAYSVHVLPDDSMVVAGRGVKPDGNPAVTLLKLTASGRLDTSFNGSGKVGMSVGPVSSLSVVTADADNRILAAGRTSPSSSGDEELLVMRFNGNGSLDTSFNGTGIFSVSLGDYRYQSLRGLEVRDDGKIIASGTVSTPYAIVLLQLNADGTPDEGFAPGGVATTAFEGVTYCFVHNSALQDDGKLLLGGFPAAQPHAPVHGAALRRSGFTPPLGCGL
jgi:uncharacterized delta-60 repeat protein